MDFPTFFLGLLKEQTALMSAVAWPLAVVWIACLFRKEVRVLIGRVASIRSPFADVELKEELAQTQAAVANAVINSDAESQAALPTGGADEETVGRDEVVTATLRGRKEKTERLDSHYLRWLATYRKLGGGSNAHDEVGMLVAQHWVPVERLVSDMYAFATGIAQAAGVSTSSKAIRLANAGVISDDEAEAVIEFEALTMRLRNWRSNGDELSTLDRYASMSDSLAKLLKNRLLRLKNTQAQADAANA